jgi:hypothetical protein
MPAIALFVWLISHQPAVLFSPAQQPTSSSFLSEQISTSHQPPAKRTGCMTFSNATVYTSRVTSYDVTQLSVAPRSMARPKGLVVANIDCGGLFLKFYYKKG